MKSLCLNNDWKNDDDHVDGGFKLWNKAYLIWTDSSNDVEIKL